MISDDKLKALRKAPPSWVDDPATPPQVGYIKGLVESRQVPEPWLLRIKELMETEGGLRKGKAGEIIKALKGLPLKPGEDNRSKNNPRITDIPPGRYAVERAVTHDGVNDISYFRVKDVKGGPEKQGGYRIIMRIAGPNEHLLSGQESVYAVKAIIRFGLGNAAVLYGRTIGRCSQCNTQITNRLSRELGIGPVCGGRVYGDTWQARVKTAESALRARGLDPRENVD